MSANPLSMSSITAGQFKKLASTDRFEAVQPRMIPAEEQLSDRVYGALCAVERSHGALKAVSLELIQLSKQKEFASLCRILNTNASRMGGRSNPAFRTLRDQIVRLGRDAGLIIKLGIRSGSYAPEKCSCAPDLAAAPTATDTAPTAPESAPESAPQSTRSLAEVVGPAMKQAANSGYTQTQLVLSLLAFGDPDLSEIQSELKLLTARAPRRARRARRVKTA